MDKGTQDFSFGTVTFLIFIFFVKMAVFEPMLKGKYVPSLFFVDLKLVTSQLCNVVSHRIQYTGFKIPVLCTLLLVPTV